MDELEAEEGRPYKYPRSAQLGIWLVRVALDRDLRTARTRVQSDPELRALFGFPPMSDDDEELIEEDLDVDDFPEEMFPSRTAIRDFGTRWLERPANRVLLDAISEEAYTRLPGDVLARFGGETALVAFDVTRCASGLKQQDVGGRVRRDDGAEFFTRGRSERSLLCRHKATVIVPDLMLVVDSFVVTPRAEARHAEELARRLAKRSESIRKWAAGGGTPGLAIFKGAAIAGDSTFGSRDFVEQTNALGFYPCALPDGYLKREVKGQATLRADGVENVIDWCSDGTHYCSCQSKRPLKERMPMKQEIKEWTSERRVLLFSCQNVVCAHSRARRKFRASVASGTALDALDWSDDYPGALNFAGSQAVERYHAAINTYMGLAANSWRGAHVVLGDTPNQLLYGLGDLIYNHIVLYNLERGVVRDEWDIEELKAAHRRKGHDIAARKKKRAEGEEKRARKALGLPDGTGPPGADSGVDAIAIAA